MKPFIMFALVLNACGGSSDGDSGAPGETGTSATEGVLPELPNQAGVAYVAHYLNNELIWTRTDGPAAVSGGSMALAGSTHDVDLDAVNDRLVVVHDVVGQVDIYQLERPKNASSAVTEPVLKASIRPDLTPLFARVDAYHQRLYLFTIDGNTGESMMEIYDDSAEEPSFLGSFAVPTSAAWDIDPVRQLLFIYDPADGGVHVHDLFGDSPKELDGSPIPFNEWYPEENSWAFSVRNLRVEPWTGRVFAGRPQGTLSELMAFSYDGVVPGPQTAYSQLADMTSVTKLEDAFDVSVSHEERPYLLESHGAVADVEDELLFVSGRAWNGTASTDLVLSMNSDLEDLGACPDQDDGWCWLRSYSSGEPGSYLMAEGANCVDQTNNVLVTTTVDLEDGEGAGQLMLFSYDSAGKMSPMLKSSGSNPVASVYPVDAVCH